MNDIVLGSRVIKKGGSFQYTGTVVSLFETTTGEKRIVLEFDNPISGMLHIYRLDQVELLTGILSKIKIGSKLTKKIILDRTKKDGTIILEGKIINIFKDKNNEYYIIVEYNTDNLTIYIPIKTLQIYNIKYINENSLVIEDE